MKKMYILLIVTFGLLIFSGCSSTSDDPYATNQKYALNKAEIDFLVNYVRKFLSKSKKLNLTEEEKAYIASNEPNIKEAYTDSKEGNIEISWELETRRIKAEATGVLTVPNKCHWEVALVKKESFQNAAEAPLLPKEAELQRRMKKKDAQEKSGN